MKLACLAIGQNPRSCTYTPFPPGAQNWAHSHSTGRGFWDTGRFSKLSYFGFILWDIQLSSRDFCEINAKVLSLIKWLVLRFTRRWFPSFDTQTSGHRAQVTNGDFGRLLVRPTLHMRALHALLLWQAITDKQRFSLSLYFFPLRGHRTGHTHSVTSCGDERCLDFRDTTSAWSSLSSA